MTDISDKTIRLYEECPKCNGHGYRNVPGSTGNWEDCPFCFGKGRIISYIPLGELEKALQEIVKAAVKQFSKSEEPT